MKAIISWRGGGRSVLGGAPVSANGSRSEANREATVAR
jgi:hypothetical protein